MKPHTHILQDKAKQEKIAGWQFALEYGVACALAFSFVSIDYQPFFYFQF